MSKPFAIWASYFPAHRTNTRQLILDGTVVRVRLSRKATSISLLALIGARAGGQKVPLALRVGRRSATSSNAG